MNRNDHPVVLLVEDEAFIRVVTADALAEGGFTVLEAEDGDTALRLLADNAQVDLLFTDLNLPGTLDGLQLSRIVEAARPGMKLVVTSGQRRLEDVELPDDGIFLSKPYRQDQICNLLRAQLTK